MDELLKVFNTAQSYAAMAWNAQQTGGVRTLPAELLAHICKSLRLRDIISAAGVSRAWRHTLISDRSCWTSVDKKSSDTGDWSSEIFAVVLERSGRLPIDLDLDEDCFSGGILPALDRHVHRIRSLNIGSSREIWPPMDQGDDSQIVLFPTRLAPLLTTVVAPEGKTYVYDDSNGVHDWTLDPEPDCPLNPWPEALCPTYFDPIRAG